MSAIVIMFIITALVFIVGTVICISLSFLFEEKAITVKIHIKDIIRHEVELKHIIQHLEDGELKEYAEEELKQIHKHALYIKHVLTNTK